MRLGVIIVFALTAISKESKGHFVYKFSAPAGEELCDEIEMKHLGDWRRMSLTSMMRDDADACCKKRGMSLISDEVGVTGDLVGKYIIELHNADSNSFWTSANDRKTPGKFAWENGLELGKSPLYILEDENVKPDEHCVLMEIKSETLIQLKTSKCEGEHPFICALQPIRVGKPLTEEDKESCNDVEYLDLLGFPNLRWGHKTVHFNLARHCCEQHGWSIVDASIMDNLVKLEKAYQDPTFQKKSGLKFKYYVPHSVWVGYNDLCEEMKFEWNCHEKSSFKLGEQWIEDAPNNEDGNEHCVELSLRLETKRLQINDIDCDFPGVYFMCMTNGKCPIEEQFRCEKKRNIYINDSLVEEKPQCAGLTFEFIGETNYFKYYLSDQTLTWAGAKYCLKLRGYDMASFEHPDEIQFLTPRFLGSNKTGKRDTTNPTLTQAWNTATNWLNPPKSDIKWDGVRPIDKENRIHFQTHDDIYPICGKTGVHKGVVGVLSEDCLVKLQFIHKVLKPLPNRPPLERDNEPSATTSISKLDTTTPTVDSGSFEYYMEYDDVPYDTNIDDDGPREETNKCTITCNDDILKIYQEKCPYSSVTTSCTQTRNFSGESISKIKLQNSRIRGVSIQLAVKNSPDGHDPPKYSFKLLEKATDIYWRLCPDIPYTFLQTAYYLFHDLHRMTSQGRTEYLTKKEYDWTTKILNKCDFNITGLCFTTTECGTPIIGAGSCSHFICTHPMFEFDIHNWDPIVDIMWFIYELVHSACFPYFSASYRMFHKFSAAIMDLWTKDIRLRWTHQIEDSSFWKRILGPFYEMNLINMQRCNTAIIKVAKLNLRLSKQQLPSRIRLHGHERD